MPIRTLFDSLSFPFRAVIGSDQYAACMALGASNVRYDELERASKKALAAQFASARTDAEFRKIVDLITNLKIWSRGKFGLNYQSKSFWKNVRKHGFDRLQGRSAFAITLTSSHPDQRDYAMVQADLLAQIRRIKKTFDCQCISVFGAGKNGDKLHIHAVLYFCKPVPLQLVADTICVFNGGADYDVRLINDDRNLNEWLEYLCKNFDSDRLIALFWFFCKGCRYSVPRTCKLLRIDDEQLCSVNEGKVYLHQGGSQSAAVHRDALRIETASYVLSLQRAGRSAVQKWDSLPKPHRHVMPPSRGPPPVSSFAASTFIWH